MMRAAQISIGFWVAHPAIAATKPSRENGAHRSMNRWLRIVLSEISWMILITRAAVTTPPKRIAKNTTENYN